MQNLNSFIASGAHARVARKQPSFKACLRLGVGEEDIFQAVALGLLEANSKPSQAWAPAKAKMITWAFYVIRTSLCRLARAACKEPLHEPEEKILPLPSEGAMAAPSPVLEGLKWEARLAWLDGDIKPMTYKILCEALETGEMPEELPEDWTGVHLSKKVLAEVKAEFRRALPEAELWLRENA